jgi:lysophospholipase L1-like esterase
MARAILILGLILAGQEADPSLVPHENLDRLGAAGSPVRKGEVIAFFGDSITMQGEDAGRKGYLTLLRKALETGEGTRDQGARVLGFGLNGGRVPTMFEGRSPWGDIRDSSGKPGTFQDMLDREKPTLVVIALGINDVWHREKGTPPREYEAGLLRMLDSITKAKARAVLCTPTIIGSKAPGANEFDRKLDEYSDIVRRLGAARKAAVADHRKAFQDFIRRYNKEGKESGFVTYDQVHMLAAGNALLAEGMAGAILEALKAAK